MATTSKKQILTFFFGSTNKKSTELKKLIHSESKTVGLDPVSTTNALDVILTQSQKAKIHFNDMDALFGTKGIILSQSTKIVDKAEISKGSGSEDVILTAMEIVTKVYNLDDLSDHSATIKTITKKESPTELSLLVTTIADLLDIIITETTVEKSLPTVIKSSHLCNKDKDKIFEFKAKSGKNSHVITGIKPLGIKHIIKYLKLWVNTETEVLHIGMERTKDLFGDILRILKDDVMTKGDPFSTEVVFGMPLTTATQLIKSNAPRVTRDDHAHTIRTEDSIYKWDNTAGKMIITSLPVWDTRRYTSPILGVNMKEDDTDEEIAIRKRFFEIHGIINEADRTMDLAYKIFWDNVTFKPNEHVAEDDVNLDSILKRNLAISNGVNVSTELGPGWIKDWVLTDNQELRKQNLLTMLTRVFTYNVKDNYMFFLNGMQGSGKSTFVKLIKSLAGNTTGSSSLESLMNDPSGFNAANIAHKTGAFLSELSASVVENTQTALIKELTGGGDLRFANKGQDGEVTSNGTTFIIESNAIPLFKDASQRAMDRRIRIIEMNNKVDILSDQDFRTWYDFFSSNMFKKHWFKDIVRHWEKVIVDGKKYFDNEEWHRPFREYKTKHNDLGKFVRKMLYDRHKAVSESTTNTEPQLTISTAHNTTGEQVGYDEMFTKLTLFVAAYKNWRAERGMNTKVHVNYIEEDLQNVMTEIDPRYIATIIRSDVIRVIDNTTNNERVSAWWLDGVNVETMYTEYAMDVEAENIDNQQKTMITSVKSTLMRLYGDDTKGISKIMDSINKNFAKGVE